MATDNDAFEKFKATLLNVSVDSVVGAEVLSERTEEVVNMAIVKEALSNVRHFVTGDFEPDDFNVASVMTVANETHYTTTILTLDNKFPIVLNFLDDIDAKSTMGDLGECQLHVNQQPYVLANGEILNHFMDCYKKFTKDEMVNMTPMFWVNRSLNARRRIVSVINGNKDILEPSQSFNKLMRQIQDFLGVIKLGQSPTLRDLPSRNVHTYPDRSASTFYLAVTNRGRILFSIRF